MEDTIMKKEIPKALIKTKLDTLEQIQNFIASEIERTKEMLQDLES